MRAGRKPVLIALTTAAAALLTALLPVSTPSAAAAAPQPDSALYTQRLKDDFNSIDTNTWKYRTDGKRYSCQQADNVSARDGHLVIALKKESATCDGKAYEYSGGGLISKKKFRYGYYETRAKINKGPGWHTAFWSMCGNTSNTADPCRKTEIDGFEIESSRPKEMRHNIFDWTRNGLTVSSQMYDSGIDTSADWHTYGYLYDETGVTFYIDGKPAPQKGQVDANGKLKWTATEHPGDWMNIWLTSIAYETPPAGGSATGEVLFDYVTFSEKNRYIDNDEPLSGTYTESGSGWATSGDAKSGFAESTSRYSCTSGSSAQWSTQGLAPGKYTAWVYNVSNATSDPAAKLTFTHDGTATTSTLDQKTTPTGWKQIGGTVTLGSGNQSIKIAASGTGCARADSVKFVRTA
ncbi:family 16 glycosylhydrolase [Streptomyces sp. NPDC048636]|uniref:family 16 glycosylhydrolase n=1 Tax=Streptomyces sp. NPDC048636 TaxID=3155762 RepID=UPI00342F7AAE